MSSERYESTLDDVIADLQSLYDNYNQQSVGDLDVWISDQVDDLIGQAESAKEEAQSAIEEREDRIGELEAAIEEMKVEHAEELDELQSGE